MDNFLEILVLLITFVLVSAIVDVWKYELKMFTIKIAAELGHYKTLVETHVARLTQTLTQRRWHPVPLLVMPPLIHMPPLLQLALCDHLSTTRKGSNHHYDQCRCRSCGAMLYKTPRYD